MLEPDRTVYHRWLGWHAPALRRLVVAAPVGVVVGLVMAQVVIWPIAVLSGWDGAALVFLVSVWPVIIRASGANTEHLAAREDLTRRAAQMLLLAASGASLGAVAIALTFAKHLTGGTRFALVMIAMVTLVVSWAVLNTVFTLRYADLYYRVRPSAIVFPDIEPGAQLDYRDFAYLAFTIGMTYQVSDTVLRDPQSRRTVLMHAFLAYVFGVVIVAAGVNIVAGLA